MCIRDRSIPDPHRRRRRSASGTAARHRWSARLRGHAHRVPGWVCRSRLPRAVHGFPVRSAATPLGAVTGMGRRDHRPFRRGHRGFRQTVRHHAAQLHPRRLWIRSRPQRGRQHARGHLPARRHRRLAARRRWRAMVQPRHVPLEQNPHRGPGRGRHAHPNAGHEPRRQRPCLLYTSRCV